MAGHNKWSKIRHRKAVVDKRRSKVWSKVSRAMIVAARHGGPDPNFNLSLRYAIDEARYANMPRDVIERAIKKGAGGDDTANYENVRYEGYAPGGIAIVVDALTDNRTRTVNLVRDAFHAVEGNLGASGCVAYMFQHRGRIEASATGLSIEAAMDAAIEAGALDAEPPANDDEHATWTILTDPTRFDAVKQGLEKRGFAIVSAELAMIPESRVEARGERAKAVIELIDALEDLDDVQKVYTNADIPDEELGE